MERRIPWEIVETLPSTDAALIAAWRSELAAASSDAEEARASVGLALTLYWACQEGIQDDQQANLAQRTELVVRSGDLSRRCGDADCIATSLLGELYALWGPDHFERRDRVVAELGELSESMTDDELRVRTAEWQVIQEFHKGDKEAARERVELFAADPAVRANPMFARREELWRANLAMIDGRIDEALRINTDAISATAQSAGSPFSFQNVAVTMAIERYLRRGLDDVVESIRSIRASSPRVGANWDAGLAFSLAETGRMQEAAELFEALAADGFASIPRDLNWLVTMHLLALVALHLGDTERSAGLLDALGPFSGLDALHGAGYASYGPVGRVVARLAAATGDLARSDREFESTLGSCAAGPWRNLLLFDRARAFGDTAAARSLRDASTAVRGFTELQMDGWIDDCEALRAELVGRVPLTLTVVPRDRGYVLHHDLGTAEVTGKGAGYLLRLLRNPGEAHDVVDLEGGRPMGAGDRRSTDGAVRSESSLDAAATRDYRRRLGELQSSGRPLGVRDKREVDFLVRELAAAAHRVPTSTEDERARVRVTKAVRRCIDSVCEQAPALGEHLLASVSTGMKCMYAPSDGRAWELVGPPGGKAPGRPRPG